MIKKRVGIVFLVTGAALLIAALLLFLHNVREDELAGEASGAALSAIQNAIDELGYEPQYDVHKLYEQYKEEMKVDRFLEFRDESQKSSTKK